MTGHAVTVAVIIVVMGRVFSNAWPVLSLFLPPLPNAKEASSIT